MPRSKKRRIESEESGESEEEACLVGPLRYRDGQTAEDILWNNNLRLYRGMTKAKLLPLSGPKQKKFEPKEDILRRVVDKVTADKLNKMTPEEKEKLVGVDHLEKQCEIVAKEREKLTARMDEIEKVRGPLLLQRKKDLEEDDRELLERLDKEVAELREKEKWLDEEKKRLDEEKKRLDEKEKRLDEERMLLLQRAQAPAPPPPEDQLPVMSLSKPINIEMKWKVPLLLERDEATAVFDTYSRNFFHGNREEKDALCWGEKGARLLTTVGVVGTGKTSFIKAMANRVNADGRLGIIVSYNEGETRPIDLGNNKKEFVSRFVAQLLRYNGNDVDDVVQNKVRPPSLDELIAALLRDHKDRVKKGIVIFIDELVLLLKSPPDPTEGEREMYSKKEVYDRCLQAIQYLNSDLIAFSNRRSGTQVMFVFTALTHVFCDSLSGRPSVPLPLSNLTPEGAWEALGDVASARVRDDKGLLQLFLSFAGHPRLISELRAELKGGCAPSPTNDCGLILTRGKMARALSSKAKFELPSDLGDIWVRWFRDELEDDEKRRLRECGILQPLREGDEQLLPMLVHLWMPGDEHKLLHHHLLQAYCADAVLHQDHEKDFEHVMMNWEAVKKVILNKPVSLSKFFEGGRLSNEVAATEVTVRIPNTNDLIMRVAHFGAEHKEAVLRLLTQGYTVMSEKQDETGVEYLSPYLKKDENEVDVLYVALVQCKFVQSETDPWKTLRERIQGSPAKKLLDSARIASFMVFFTTVDLTMLRDQSVIDGVYFIEDSLFTFTRKLGILRMHIEKTGDVLKRRGSFGAMTGAAQEENG